ncbi:MAG: folylpolyglutamate synthase/dihydrofolate synthase family protein [Planctomycetota bacterium]
MPIILSPSGRCPRREFAAAIQLSRFAPITTHIPRFSPMERSDPQYVEAIRFLLDRINFERSDDRSYNSQAFRLARMAYLLELLDNPQWSAPVIHVAGTKGKGSTAWLIAETLRHAGLRTGLYTSPHLEHLEERFVVDGAPVSEEKWVAAIPRLRQASDTCNASEHGPPTFFELTTALAWLLFQSGKTHANVIEVGLGGRLDSTNVCSPALCLITSISYDHQQQLGATLDKIAFEKAGIIKDSIPVIHGARAEEAKQVIRRVAAERGCALWELGRDFEAHVDTHAIPAKPFHRGSRDREGQPENTSHETELESNSNASSQTISFRSHHPHVHGPIAPALPLRMLGAHQGDNAALAIAAWSRLRHDGWAIPESALRSALSQTQVPARIETIPWDPLLIIDAAHNEASIDALFQALDANFIASRRTLIFACSKDKKMREMLERILPSVNRLILTQFHSNPRAVLVETLEEIARSVQCNGEGKTELLSAPDVGQAIEFVSRTPLRGELVCVTGSFFIAAEARAYCRTFGAIR